MTNGLMELYNKKVIHHDFKPENILIQLFPYEEITPEIKKKKEEIKEIASKKPHMVIKNNNNQNNNITNKNNGKNITTNGENENKKDEEEKENILKVLKKAQYKLSDFRFSKFRDEIIEKKICGAFLYMSPELFLPETPINSIENYQVDIWL